MSVENPSENRNEEGSEKERPSFNFEAIEKFVTDMGNKNHEEWTEEDEKMLSDLAYLGNYANNTLNGKRNPPKSYQ